MPAKPIYSVGGLFCVRHARESQVTANLKEARGHKMANVMSG